MQISLPIQKTDGEWAGRSIRGIVDCGFSHACWFRRSRRDRYNLQGSNLIGRIDASKLNSR